MIVCVGTSISELPSGGVLGAEMDPSVLLSWADIDIAIRGRSMYLLLVSKGNPKQKVSKRGVETCGTKSNLLDQMLDDANSARNMEVADENKGDE